MNIPCIEKPAIDGGVPVRTKPLPMSSIGSSIIGDEELKLVTEVIRSKSLFRHYGPGTPHMVDDFESEAEKYFGVKYALATATGSGAFSCALVGLGIGPGDEVIIPTFGWYTDFTAVVLAGALPVFADVDESMNLNPESFESKITKNTKAVIVVHYQGAASRLDDIVRIARRHRVRVLEDVAQACGGSYEGKKLGSFGDVACFSLQTNKVITSGEGGLLITDDRQLFERAVRFHDLGLMRPMFEKKLGGDAITKEFVGLQWRMNELSGAVALAQIRKLPGIIETCGRLSRLLKKLITDGIPDIRFRAVKEENDIGIAVFLDMNSEKNALLFSRAIETEGLRASAASSCTLMSSFPSVMTRSMPHPDLPPFGKGYNGARVTYSADDFEKSGGIVRRMTSVVVAPTYTEDDIRDIAHGIVKTVAYIKQKGK